ncbi:Sugar transferase involved in LPS biosynthesis (colanic, teichoic acid) [Pseudomonas panipatensis]|uniref:Sugar transferase involved in LPS biosynthesis (Colanic, teichoic acid) n=2 Tax=Pseudomonas panipatensis TaxID=428992 RepID=A0A1G8INH9_9PSED|nr:sugar transferase [Pseudomonas panipatensis]SDI20433.1 Sugar transferase involved in LPS biosynthesis (colanic, teichoic acid) [Pseudomonas panipatensis]SMP73424.1 Sugar transferase involved in LPS biosynthesis (colanic, teichoic acid) [Pseudomonas panipatensis]
MEMEKSFPSSGTGEEATTQARKERREGELRQKIAEATARNDRGWISGRPGGRPWTLSRSKRCTSATLALLILLCLAPLMLLVALAVKLSSPGPVFFVQQRTGIYGRRFGMIKFRTMVVDAEKLKDSLRHLNKHGPASVDFKIDRDPRITPIGRLLRRSSLDELPNLFNVVLGQMRLVGPRPTSFNARTYREHHLSRLGVYPGITGLWQISGRSDVDFDGRVLLDMAYIAEQSPWLDLKILLKTPLIVITGHGAS